MKSFCSMWYVSNAYVSIGLVHVAYMRIRLVHIANQVDMSIEDHM